MLFLGLAIVMDIVPMFTGGSIAWISLLFSGIILIYMLTGGVREAYLQLAWLPVVRPAYRLSDRRTGCQTGVPVVRPAYRLSDRRTGCQTGVPVVRPA